MEICVFCKQSLENLNLATVKLREKGSRGINAASAARRDDIITVTGQTVHIQCRKEYCNPNYIKRDANKKCLPVTSFTTPKLRSEKNAFDFKQNCLFCGHHAKLEGKKRGFDVYPVVTLQFEKSVKEICQERADDWAMIILQRFSTVSDLPAAEAIYHQKCNVNFRFV